MQIFPANMGWLDVSRADRQDDDILRFENCRFLQAIEKQRAFPSIYRSIEDLSHVSTQDWILNSVINHKVDDWRIQ